MRARRCGRYPAPASSHKTRSHENARGAGANTGCWSAKASTFSPFCCPEHLERSVLVWGDARPSSYCVLMPPDRDTGRLTASPCSSRSTAHWACTSPTNGYYSRSAGTTGASRAGQGCAAPGRTGQPNRGHTRPRRAWCQGRSLTAAGGTLRPPQEPGRLPRRRRGAAFGDIFNMAPMDLTHENNREPWSVEKAKC